jgi:anti-sigma28 factor (negative regulator of flagellin synthesis)
LEHCVIIAPNSIKPGLCPARHNETADSKTQHKPDKPDTAKRAAMFRPSQNQGLTPANPQALLFQMKSLSDLSVADLRRVIALKEQIESFEGQLESIAGESSADAANPAEAPAPAKRAKRRLSAAHRRKLIKALAKARKMRWAKAKEARTNAVPKKRRMSAAGRAAISAAAKARWARVRAAKA